MTNPLRTQAATHIGLLFLRLGLGVPFFLFGVDKLFVIGTSNFVKGSSAMIPAFLPKPIGETYLYLVPIAEMLVGLFLVLGLCTRLTAFITALMLTSYIIAATGLRMDTSWLHPHFNDCFLMVALALVFLGAGAASVDRAVFKVR